MKQLVLVVVMGSVFLLGIYGLQKLPAGMQEAVDNYMAYSVKMGARFPQEILSDVKKFPLPLMIRLVLPNQVLLSEKLMRLPVILIGIGVLVLWAYFWKEERVLSTLMLVVTPWFVKNSLFDFGSILTLFFSLLAWVGFKNKWNRWWKLAIVTCLSLSSLAGLIMAGVLSTVWSWKEKWIYLFVILLGMGVRLSPTAWWKSTVESHVEFSLGQISGEVDQRVRAEYKINGEEDIWPIQIKRIGYNKYNFLGQKLAKEAIKLFDLEWMASPAQLNTTVSKDLWGEKGISLIYFWELILAGWGMFKLEKLSKIAKEMCLLATVVAGIAAFFSPSSEIEGAGFLVVVPIVILSALGMRELLKNKWLALTSVFILWGVISTYHHFLIHEEYWRDNRPIVFKEMMIMWKKYGLNNKTTMSAVLAPTQYYWAWSAKVSPKEFWSNFSENPTVGNTTFRHFDLSKEPYQKGEVYIGLPGEFLGNKLKNRQNDFSPSELPLQMQLLSQASFRDAVSYGNGNFVWAVKIK